MKRAAGFTLVELLVALFMMALMAGLGWRSLDGMARAQAETDLRADQVLALQAGLAQWGADLDAMAQLPQTTAIEWDGRALRVIRRGMAGTDGNVYVVAWTQRQERWLRWQSAPLGARREVAEAWQQAGLWSQNPGEAERRHETAVTPLQEWQIFYFRGDSWSHPLSSDSLIPDGVRLVLVLPQGQALAGRVVRDWVSPKLAGGKS